MTPADRKRLVVTLTGVYAFFDKDLSEFAIRVWEDAIGGLPMDDVERAFAAHIRDVDAGRFLPKPADIIRQLRGSAAEAGELAWASVLDQVRSGRGFLPEHGEPVRQAVFAIGGCSAIGRCDERDLGHLQRRFLASFAAFQHREEVNELLGMSDEAKQIAGAVVRRIGSAA